MDTWKTWCIVCAYISNLYLSASLVSLEIQWISVNFNEFQWFWMDCIAFMCACMGVHTNSSWLLGNPGWLCVHTYEIYIYQQALFLHKLCGFQWISIDFIDFQRIPLHLCMHLLVFSLTHDGYSEIEVGCVWIDMRSISISKLCFFGNSMDFHEFHWISLIFIGFHSIYVCICGCSH